MSGELIAVSIFDALGLLWFFQGFVFYPRPDPFDGRHSLWERTFIAEFVLIWIVLIGLVVYECVLHVRIVR